MKTITKYICESCNREYYDSDNIIACVGCDKDVCINDEFCASSENYNYHHKCYLAHLRYESERSEQ